MSSKLAIFDFDNTLINGNCYEYLDEWLLENKKYKNLMKNKLYCDIFDDDRFNLSIEEYELNEIKFRLIETIIDYILTKITIDDYSADFKLSHWIESMNTVFEALMITQSDIEQCLKRVRVFNSMVNMIKYLKEQGYTLIIVSDANTFFIDFILKQSGLENLFNYVYTNSADFKSGYLKLTSFNQVIGNNDAFKCNNFCASNLCKGYILNYKCGLLNDNGTIDRVVYFGDGKNDACASLQLRSKSDYLFVREKFKLADLLDNPYYKNKIKANVVYWTSNNDLVNIFKKMLN